MDVLGISPFLSLPIGSLENKTDFPYTKGCGLQSEDAALDGP